MNLINYLRHERPHEDITPTDTNPEPPLLQEVIAQFVWLRLLVKPISPWTLYYKWYLPTQKAMRKDGTLRSAT